MLRDYRDIILWTDSDDSFLLERGTSVVIPFLYGENIPPLEVAY